MSRVFVLVMIEINDIPVKDEKTPLFDWLNFSQSMISIEPIGVCSTKDQALDYIDELEELHETIGISDGKVMFDIFEYTVDEVPFMIEYMQKRAEDFEDEVSKSLRDLINRGLVDQLIGEDGHFYYQLTEEGKKLTSIPKNIRKFFRNE